MNNQFDELTKNLAESVTRRGALKKFGVGLAGMALACFGLANKAEAGPRPKRCKDDKDCNGNDICRPNLNPNLWGVCKTPCSSPTDCQVKGSSGPCCWPIGGRVDYTGVCDAC